MKRLLVILALPLLLAAEKPWPQKGDLLYFPKELRAMNPSVFQATPILVPACDPMLVLRKTERYLHLRDSSGMGQCFATELLPTFKSSAKECKTAVPETNLELTVSRWNRCFMPTH